MNASIFQSFRSYRPLLAALTLVPLVVPASAAGPIGLCDTGQPLRWPAGGIGIPFNPDQGDLGSLANGDAVSLVQAAFDVWGSVPSATATYSNAGPLPVDVDFANFADYLFPAAPDGLSAIVFDHTGEIFDLLFGPDSGILGFAGPEWVDLGNCTILEGVSFLNGPAFTDPTYAFDVMVHEFGHYSGLGHTVVNGQIYIGDTTGPTPDMNTFGPPPDPFAEDVVETMYPYYFGPGVNTSTPEKDDISSLSSLYPEAGFLSTGTITGVVRTSAGLPLTGVNVIARNLADPFNDAVSAISGDYGALPGDAFEGVFTLRGLTPGANYAVYVDQILAGGFSAPVALLPGPEEFYNGAGESNNLTSVDDPAALVPVNVAAAATTSGIDIVMNSPRPGQPLLLGDDGSYQLSLPFPIELVGQSFNSVWVNANGNLTFGAPDGSFSPSVAGFLDGPPRIAGLWRDLNPGAGGMVTFAQTKNTFTVLWKNVPAFPNVGANSFSITLKKAASHVQVTYGTLTAVDAGIAGFSGGGAVTGGSETPENLVSGPRQTKPFNLHPQPARFEQFSVGSPCDLARKSLLFERDIDYEDAWAESNDSFESATPITLPFNSSALSQYTEIEPTGGDVDYFQFPVAAGDIIKVELTRGPFDSVVGIFAPDGTLVAVDDDSGLGLLSKLHYGAPTAGTYVVAVSAFSDFDFSGDGGSGGRYVVVIDTVNPGVPSPANWVTNPSFETGDFLAWNVIETGTPFIPLTVTDGSLATYFTPAVPQDGNYLAVGGFDGEGPMKIALYQDVAIPAGEPFLTLEWKERLQYELFTATLSRIHAVLIVDPATNNLLRVVSLLDTGTAPAYTDTGWVDQSFDVSEFIGQNIRLMFYQEIPEAFSGPGQFELDDVRLRSE